MKKGITAWRKTARYRCVEDLDRFVVKRLSKKLMHFGMTAKLLSLNQCLSTPVCPEKGVTLLALVCHCAKRSCMLYWKEGRVERWGDCTHGLRWPSRRWSIERRLLWRPRAWPTTRPPPTRTRSPPMRPPRTAAPSAPPYSRASGPLEQQRQTLWF